MGLFLVFQLDSPSLVGDSPYFVRILNWYYGMGSSLREELSETYKKQLTRNVE